jgi:hypothetical protein
VYFDSPPGQTNIWFGQNFNILGVLYEGKTKSLYGDHVCPSVLRKSMT